MDKYTFEGTTFNVNPNRLEEFLEKYPDAEKVEEQETYDTKKYSYEYDPSQGYFGETIDREITNIGTRGINAFLKAIKGIGEYGVALEIGASDWYGQNIAKETEQEKAERQEKIRINQENNIFKKTFDPVIEKLEEGYIKSEKGITEQFEAGNYAEMSRQIVSGGVESIPSLVAAYSGVGGLTALAVSVGGNKFDEEFEKEPEKSSGQLLLNATGSGAIEAGFELVTRGIMSKAGILKNKGQLDEAKEIIEEGSKNIVKNIGVGVTGEALAESSTTLTSLLYDQLTLDRKIDWPKAKYEIFDSGIIGGFVGGNITSVGEYAKSTPQAKERAISILTHPTINNEIIDRAKNINRLSKDLASSSPEGKKLIQKEINKELLEIQGLRNRSEQGLLNLNKEELQQYAKNVEESIKLGRIINSETESSEAKKAAKKQNEGLVKSNLSMLEASSERTLEANLALAKDADAKLGLEQIVIETDAEFAALPGGESGADGFISDGKVYINREIASKLASVSVGSHELLHGVTAAHLLDSDGLVTKEGIEFIDNMRNRMSTKERDIVEKRIEDNYKYERDAEGKITRTKDKNEYYDEYLNVFHDAIVKKQITYNPAIEKIGQVFSKLFNRKGFDNIKFNSGRDVYDFVKSYSKDILKGKVSEKTISFAKPVEGTVNKKSVSVERRNQISSSVQEIGSTYSFEGGKKAWDEGGADQAITEIKTNNYLDDLIAAKYKADKVPVDFVDKVYAELTSHIKNFNPETNDNLFGWINSQLANKAGNVYNREYKKQEQEKTAKDVDDRTKEGEVKVQVAAEVDPTLEALETEDISPAARARKRAEKAKPKAEQQSKFRKAIGIETGSDLYNKVLDSARKALLRAYEVGTPARNIQRKLRDEANLYLFKDVKNFLGTKQYVSNLKKFREAIMDVMFTADLVQMEREVADDKRVFTKFVKKLTSKKEVEDAVSARLLPESALNIIDKGTAVSLYEKKNVTEAGFLSFFDIPAFNPATGKRSGKRGTRKDQLAKYISGALAYDATLEVAQQPEVIEKRQQIAELKGETIDTDDIQTLASSIGRNPNVKFSLSSEQIVENLQVKIEELINKANKDKNYLNKIITVERDKDGKPTKYILKTKLERDRGMPGPKEHSQENKNAIAKIVYKYITNNEYGSIVNDKKLESQLLQDIIIDNRNNKTTNLGIAHENMVKKLLQDAVSAVKSALQVVGGGKLGDIYMSFPGSILGIETKLEKARGVSQLLTFLNNNLDINFTNKNNTTNDNDSLFDDIIGKEIQKNYKKFLKDLPKELGEVKNFTLTQQQADWLKANGRSNYLAEIEVPIEYIASAYASGKYKDAPQGFIVIGRNIYRMVTGNTNIDSMTSNIVAESGLDIKDLQLIKDKKVKLVAEFMSDIGKNKKINFRIAPRIDINNYESSNVDITKSNINKKFINAAANVLNKKPEQIKSKAVRKSRSANNPTKGITVLDFDDTLATTQSLVKFTRPDGTTGTLNAEQYASTYESLLDQGYKFDFSEFNKVVKGKLAPLFNKAIKLQGKFGPKNMFVLTARPPQAQKAIFDFLKANGLNIPLENITGLGNSTAEAKALWMADKVAEGYNDFYFADDALQNVQAVKNMLDQFDVKSKVQQAKIKFSQSMDGEFNKILEDVTGIEAKKRFSDAKARKRGEGKGRFRMFIPPSHEDFIGLLYNFIGKGEKGNKHRNFFEKALVKPLNRAYRELNIAKQAIANDYKKLIKQMPDIRKKLTKNTPDGDFTYDDAVRVYLWNKAGFEIPGLSKTDTNKLIELVNLDGKLKTFADTIGLISKMEKGYTEPGEHWLAGSIKQDLADATGRVGRAKFFAEFIENADIIFNKENINKIRAAFGDNFVDALDDMLYAVKNGTNRKQGGNKQVNAFLDYLNGSVGATMFFNARSAVLQTLSTVNFINFADNNIFKAAARFADQGQFWSDFSMLFNSDYLKQRRAGVGFDVNGAEIAAAVKKAKNPVKAAIAYILNKGFLPTQMADSFAIALGGSSMYRNRVNTYIKQGLSKSEAETKAFEDFQETAESTQQSARPDMLSQLQRSALGRMIFAFQNVTSQYARLIKKSTLDLINRRKSPPYDTQVQSDMSNISKIIYYGAIQNFIFYSLQSALFAMSFEDDEDEDKRNEKFFKTKKQRLINGSIDSILRGSGLPGAILSVVKNAVIKYGEQSEKGWGRKLGVISDELLQISPPVGIKIRKLDSFEKTMAFNQKVIPEMDTFDLDNPIWDAYGNLIEGATNIPVARLNRKVENVRSALNSENAWWQRLALGLGWSKWELGIEDKEVKEVKERINNNNKQINKETKIKKRKVRERKFR